jgi:NHS family xanthosine MFS transporter
MSIKLRLTILNFLQFFIWGSWLISTGAYLFGLGFSGIEIGRAYSTLGIASLFMPALLGIVADRWVNAEKVLGISHIAGAVMLIYASTVKDPSLMFWVMLFNSMAYMPTIAMSNTVSYRVLEQSGYDIVKVFPPIRVWGTVGFILAMWISDLSGFAKTNYQFYMAAASAVVMGIYCFTIPACKPAGKSENNSIISALGLDAFVLFKTSRMTIFFFFSMLLGAALQITNTFGDSFLRDFSTNYADSFIVKHGLITLSLSQISETLFILTIPFFLKRFGIKMVMIFSMIAWVLRFGFFALGNPGAGFPFLILSMIVYGMAFDFFNISGSLFVEKESPSNIRASAQGLFMMVTNGLGAIIGGIGSGWVVDYFTKDGVKDWVSIWFAFAGYALVLTVVFPLIFKYKHNPEEPAGEVRH